MQRCIKVASWFFAAGAIVGFLWLVYLSLAIGEGPTHYTIMKVTFPGILLRWPGMPVGGLTGGMILVFFAVTTVANGLIYALLAVGVYELVHRSQNSN